MLKYNTLKLITFCLGMGKDSAILKGLVAKILPSFNEDIRNRTVLGAFCKKLS